MITNYRLPLLGLVAISLGGCSSVGRDYVEPRVALPEAFHANPVAGQTAEQTAAETDLSQWWKIFNDPVLDFMISQLVESNLDLRIAEARMREVRAQKGLAEGDLFPKVNASGTVTNNRLSESAPQGKRGGELSYNLFNAGFDASWELDIFGGTRRAVEAASAEIEAVDEARNGLLVTLSAEVVRNYIDLRATQMLVAITEDNLKTQIDTLKLTQARYDAGLASYLDVARGEALLLSTRAQIPSLQRLIQQSINRLRLLLGKDPGRNSDSLSSKLQAVSAVPVASKGVTAGLPSGLLLRRPDIRRAERDAAAASARIGVATADLFPRFSLTGSFGLQGTEAGDIAKYESRFWTIGPAFRWPIFTAGKVRANVKVQDARYEEALIRYEQTVLTALEDVENALVAHANEEDRRQFLSEAAQANQQSVALATELYTKGLSDFLSVLDAQRTMLDAQSRLTQSEAAVSINLVALCKALGGGWEKP